MLDRETLRTDPHAFRKALDGTDSQTLSELSRTTGIPRSTLTDWQAKHRDGTVTPAAVSGHTRSFDVTVEPGTSARDMLTRRGIDPDEWDIVSLHVQDAQAVGKGGEPIDLERMRVTLKPKAAKIDLTLLQPPEPKPIAFPVAKRVDVSEPKLIAVTSDPHHPHIERPLQSAFVQFMADLQPQEHYELGDGQNASRFGRFGTNRAFNEHLNDGLDSEVQAWHDEKQASPGTRRVRLPGNHDGHLLRYQLERASAIVGVRPGMLQEELDRGEVLPDALSLRTLLRADEFGIEMVEVAGEYHDARIKIAPGLVAVHGEGTGRSGAQKAVSRLLCSQMQGHDHFQKLEYLTRYDEDHRAGDSAACSVGARAQRGLGYQKDGDVQQGFATVTVWPDGRWHIELARWDAGELVWRDRRWSA